MECIAYFTTDLSILVSCLIADGGSGNGTSSPFLGHSQSTAAGGGGAIATFSEQRGPTGSFQMAGATVGGVQMRNEPSTAGPRDSVRRSRNLENKGGWVNLAYGLWNSTLLSY